jgi:hypothetical protein
MFQRVTLIIVNCSTGKIELSEYAIPIISPFTNDQGSKNYTVLFLICRFKILSSDEVIHQLFSIGTPTGIPSSTQHLHAGLKLTPLQNHSSHRPV